MQINNISARSFIPRLQLGGVIQYSRRNIDYCFFESPNAQFCRNAGLSCLHQHVCVCVCALSHMTFFLRRFYRHFLVANACTISTKAILNMKRDKEDGHTYQDIRELSELICFLHLKRKGGGFFFNSPSLSLSLSLSLFCLT